MAVSPGVLTWLVTALILMSLCLVSIFLVVVSRRRIARQEKEIEEGQVTEKTVSISQYPPQLPNFSARSSLSMSEASCSKSFRTPDIRFIITTPSHRSRNSGSIDSSPSMGAVLVEYKQQADATSQRLIDREESETIFNSDLGKPRPSVMSGRE